MECILLLSRSVRVAGSGWVAGVEDRIPGAEVALELKTQEQVHKMQVLSHGVNSSAWCLAGGEVAEVASSSEQLCCVVLEAQGQACSLDTHHPLEDDHYCLDI